MKLQIIVGSTRPNRVTDRLAKWVLQEAKKIDGIEPELVDLIDYDMPFLDEAISPQYNPDRKPNPAAKRWIDKLGEADAYILVTPEYNRSISGVLKNALDYIDFQFAKKPVGLVGHGSTGGAQAISQLRAIIPGLQSITSPNAVYIVGRVGDIFNEQGELVDKAAKANPYGPMFALGNALNQLKWYGDALLAARNKDA
jgi:NAD(P)H-dependent FMN reductase